MSLNDYLKCPGPERSMAAIPEIYPCPDCGYRVEIWSDERKRRCPECNSLVEKNALLDHDRHDKETDHVRLQSIIQSAMASGASDAKIISPADLVVDDDLARLCEGDPRCENYGLSPSCPPHVAGPAGFRKLQAKSRYAIVVRIDLPSETLFSSERREIMQLLHQIVAGIAQAALKAGFKDGHAFAGGSCKKIFCHDHAQCRKLSETAQCRHPENARPSMSGFGINVAELLRSAQWDLKAAKPEDATNQASMTWVAGLILIG